MKLFKKILLGCTMAVAAIGFVDATLAPSVVDAGVFTEKPLSADTSNTQAKSLIDKINSAAQVLSAIVLSISIIMIIFGGLRYILSNGDAKQAEQGKMILLYSGLGIIIALSAFAIANFFGDFKF